MESGGKFTNFQVSKNTWKGNLWKSRYVPNCSKFHGEFFDIIFVLVCENTTRSNIYIYTQLDTSDFAGFFSNSTLLNGWNLAWNFDILIFYCFKILWELKYLKKFENQKTFINRWKNAVEIQLINFYSKGDPAAAEGAQAAAISKIIQSERRRILSSSYVPTPLKGFIEPINFEIVCFSTRHFGTLYYATLWIMV